MNGIKNLFLILGCVLTVASLDAASRNKRDPNAGLREALQDIQYEFNNHEEEIRMLADKLENQDSELEMLRGLVQDANRASKSGANSKIGAVEKRMLGVETGIKSATGDLHKLQGHANDTAKALSDFQNRIGDLENQVDNLQVAMEAIMKALNIDVELPKSKYTVKSGDTLGDIAHQHHTTIKSIKERNNLKKNTIFPGQILDIPQGK